MAVGDTKVKNNITYRLNKNHRWQKVGRATSPGQTSLFDLPIIPDTPLTSKDNAHKLKGSKGKEKAMTTLDDDTKDGLEMTVKYNRQVAGAIKNRSDTAVDAADFVARLPISVRDLKGFISKNHDALCDALGCDSVKYEAGSYTASGRGAFGRAKGGDRAKKNNPRVLIEFAKTKATNGQKARVTPRTMGLTKSQAKLVEDAENAGYTIQYFPTSVDIFKARQSGKIERGIRLSEDGTAFRLDVELGSANTIRTQKSMRSILGI